MSKNKAKLLLNSFILILIFSSIFLFFNKNNIKADSDLGVFKSESELNLVSNGKHVRFSIKFYSQDGVNKVYLFSNYFFKIKRTELFGFEDNIALCSKSTIKLEGKEVFCLVGDVGAHSQNIAFIDNQMRSIKLFENDDFFYNIVSDVPNYQVLDYNNDQFDDLIIENRNYDRNPLTDIIEKYYSGSDSSFVFDKAEYVAVK